MDFEVLPGSFCHGLGKTNAQHAHAYAASMNTCRSHQVPATPRRVRKRAGVANGYGGRKRAASSPKRARLEQHETNGVHAASSGHGMHEAYVVHGSGRGRAANDPAGDDDSMGGTPEAASNMNVDARAHARARSGGGGWGSTATAHTHTANTHVAPVWNGHTQRLAHVLKEVLRDLDLAWRTVDAGVVGAGASLLVDKDLLLQCGYLDSSAVCGQFVSSEGDVVDFRLVTWRQAMLSASPFTNILNAASDTHVQVAVCFTRPKRADMPFPADSEVAADVDDVGDAESVMVHDAEAHKEQRKTHGQAGYTTFQPPHPHLHRHERTCEVTGQGTGQGTTPWNNQQTCTPPRVSVQCHARCSTGTGTGRLATDFVGTFTPSHGRNPRQRHQHKDQHQHQDQHPQHGTKRARYSCHTSRWVVEQGQQQRAYSAADIGTNTGLGAKTTSRQPQVGWRWPSPRDIRHPT